MATSFDTQRGTRGSIENRSASQYSLAMTPSDKERLMDLLLELQHDLGKYVRMPLAFLPEGASHEDVHRALRRALLETRRGPGGSRSARQIWESFVQEGGAALKPMEGFDALVETVKRALAWERDAMEDTCRVERQRVEADLGAIGPAIRRVINELREA